MEFTIAQKHWFFPKLLRASALISPGVPLYQILQWGNISVLSTVKKKSCIFWWKCTKLLTQIEKTAFPKGVLNMLRRVLCFPKDTCQNLADIPSIEKCLASAVSLRISPLVDSRKQPCYAYFFNSFGSLHSETLHVTTDSQRNQNTELFF